MADGTRKTDTILDRIVADNREELDWRRRHLNIAGLQKLEEELVELQGVLVSLYDRITPEVTVNPYLIGEHKKASPSKGNFGLRWSVEELGEIYYQGGAVGYSVLTDRLHFQGHLYDMERAREQLERTCVEGYRPATLRKDFLFDPYHIWESRAYGADAILLIAAILDVALLSDLIAQARELGMEALVEVHDESQVEQALRAGAEIIGINNRDLKTFDVDLATTERLRPLIPDDKIVVSESGIHTRADVARLAACGIHAILVGEALVTAPDIHAKMRELII